MGWATVAALRAPAAESTRTTQCRWLTPARSFFDASVQLYAVDALRTRRARVTMVTHWRNGRFECALTLHLRTLK